VAIKTSAHAPEGQRMAVTNVEFIAVHTVKKAA
jgi:hypothetical protein